MHWRQASQRIVWRDFVVALEPFGDDLPHLLQRVEEVWARNLFSIGPVEALDVGILVGLARLDETQLDILLLTPLAALMPCLRVNRATSTSASSPFNTATICDSVNRDFFIGLPSGTKSCQKSPVFAVYRLGELTCRPQP